MDLVELGLMIRMDIGAMVGYSLDVRFPVRLKFLYLGLGGVQGT